MIHAICDFCGKDCNRDAVLVVMKPFSNLSRYHTDTDLIIEKKEIRSFVMCGKCVRKHNMPDKHETYCNITCQDVEYKKCIDND